MTREEIERALLTSGAVDIESEDGRHIVLSAPSAKRLAKVVFDNLRSSTVDNLKSNQRFFEALEAAFLDRDGDKVPSVESGEKTGESETKPDRRTWRLKKVKTRGFGGLNAGPDDTFEFDAAGRNFCIEGQNGSGKSSLANAVLFAMTGKVHRDQYGLCDEPGNSEPVVSDEGVKLGNWPPIAVYPNNWASNRPPVDVSVTLTFGNDTDNEEIKAKRRLHGEPGALEHKVSIDPRLITVPTLIESGLLMPMRIQHIRMSQADDNNQLVGLIRQLIGLEPLLDVADLVDKLAHGNQRFRKYARDNRAKEKAQQVSRLLNEAQQAIEEQGTDLDLTISVDPKKPISDDQLKILSKARKELDRRQAKGFKALEALAFKGFNPETATHRHRVMDAINQLSIDSDRQNDPKNLPPVRKGIASLNQESKKDDIEALKLALQNARSDLRAAIEWSNQQKRDTLLRLKAAAAAHFEDCADPVCPLCEQSIKENGHRLLVQDLRLLKTQAEAAQTRLSDACRRIEQDIRRAAQEIVPPKFMRVERFAVKQDMQNCVRAAFIQPTHVADSLPGFTSIAQAALNNAFKAVKEVEFGSTLPKPEKGDETGRVERLLDHLNDTVAAAENWQESRQAFRNAWTHLFSKTEAQSLTMHILELRGVIEGVEPFRLASAKIKEAQEIITKYNAIISGQALREEIVKALTPLRGLRNLVNRTTRRTISDVSDVAKDIHGQIYNPESLTYDKAELSQYRGKQSLIFQAKLGRDLDWLIDASLLANVSWMRGILWAYVFAIRKQAVERAGYCPFELMFLDDPQMTFDTRNLKGWVRFLGKPDGLMKHQLCQLLVTTHSRLFVLDLTPMPAFRMAAIETGQAWSHPTQIVEGDFAAVRYKRMLAENSDDRARSLIGDIRVLAETLLKHAIEPFDPSFVHRSDATLGRLMDRIAAQEKAKQPPYTSVEFGNLIAVKSSSPDQFSQLSEPHHSVSETITVHQARQAYRFWRETLYPSLREVWAEYRFLQKSIVGEVAAIPLPADCNHKPTRSTALASVQPTVLGRVAAYSDGRAASAIQIDHLNNGDTANFSALSAYRLEKDTLSPVASVGDILLTRMDGQCRPSNLVVEDRGSYRVARRWHEDTAAPALAVLAASSSNPREVPRAFISRAKGANRRKIVGVLFAAGQLQPGDTVDPNSEATDLDAGNLIVADLVANTEVFEVLGSSAEPIALNNQYLLAKPAQTDMATALRELDGRPVIAEDSEDCAFFKRLRVLNSTFVILESLDKTGSEGLIRLSTNSLESGPMLTRIREVVGVVFDKL